MPRAVHWFDFETTITGLGEVRVEATISSGKSGVEIEGVKVKMLDSLVEIVPSDQQMRQVRDAIYENCEPDDPADDWRNEW